MLNSQQITQLMALAAEAAQQAGHYIAGFDRSAIKVNKKAAGYSPASQVVTQVDMACEAMIHDILQPSFEPLHIAFLGEESAANGPIEQHPRLSQPYFWCVDPLDGTLPFTENVPGYAVSIALVAQNGEPVLGVIYDPVTDTLYQGRTEQVGLGLAPVLLKQGTPWQPELTWADSGQPQELALFFDRSFTTLPIFPTLVEAVKVRACQLGYGGIRVHRQAGSVMNAVQVLEQAPACYFKFPKTTPGGGSLWDFAATCALANAAGAWVSDIHGKPLQLNAADSLFMHRHGVLYASDKRIANEVMALFGRLS